MCKCELKSTGERVIWFDQDNIKPIVMLCFSAENVLFLLLLERKTWAGALRAGAYGDSTFSGGSRNSR